MKKMLPVGMYVIVALVGQMITVAISLAVEQLGFKWGSVIVFGVLYLVTFGIAWKITVLIMDGVLTRKGLVEIEKTS
jgi:hypothetical protein